MKTVHIVFPVLRGTRRFKIEKGRRWSVIEHLVLQALTAKARTAQQLSDASGGMPRRVILEAITRLMRAGWVELRYEGSDVVFDATDIGKVRSLDDELRPAITPIDRWRSFFIDEHTGAAFRIPDLQTSSRRNLPFSNDEQIVHEIPRKQVDSEDLVEIFNAIEGQDELIVGVYPSISRLTQTFGIVTYRNGTSEGMPPKPPRQFVDFIEGEYKKVCLIEETLPAVEHVAVKADAQPRPDNQYLFESSDIILDGPQNRDALAKLLKAAERRVIIHSGFVTENVEAILPSLLAAAGRQVRIDLFYGQDEQESGRTSSETALAFLERKIANTGLRDRFHIHPFSTESHAKIAVADDRSSGGWSALLGSCNWLASGFTSFDATVRLRDPKLVGELIGSLARMSKGRIGVWTETAVELSVLGKQVASIPVKGGRKAEMSLLYTKDHPRVVMDAAQSAKERIFVLSHQFGVAGQPVTIFPLLDSAQNSGLSVSAYYGKAAGKKSAADLLELRQSYGKSGLKLQSIERPRLHAKVLGWDNDNIAITSFNWLSVDPSEHKMLREIGIFIKSNRVAERFMQDFDLAQW